MTRRRWFPFCAAVLGLCACRNPAGREAAFAIVDPYRGGGSWARANFHAHTTHSHGALDAATLIDLYRHEGYAVLSITDHNMFGDQDGGVLGPEFQNDSLLHDWNGDGTAHASRIPGSGVEAYIRDWNVAPPPWVRDRYFVAADEQQPPLLIPGVEASYGYFGAHFGLIGYPPGPFAPPGPGFPWLGPLHRAGGFAFIAHPGDANGDVERFAAVLPLADFDGLEIVNGARLTRGETADATPLWDALLSRGDRLWGMANDDVHKPPGADELYPFIAFNMLLLPGPSAADVLAALHSGAFYCSTGLRFTELVLEGNTLRIAAPGAVHVRFIGRNGAVLADEAGDHASYVVRGDEGYVRAEAGGGSIAGARNSWANQAWTQPFFIEARAQ